MVIAKRKSTASAHLTHAILLSVADDSGSRDKSIERFLEFLRIRQPQLKDRLLLEQLDGAAKVPQAGLVAFASKRAQHVQDWMDDSLAIRLPSVVELDVL